MLLRALHLAALCTGFGTLLAGRLLMPARSGPGPLARIAWIALAAALLTLLPWLVLEAAAIAEVDTAAALPGALAIVLTQTWFGHVVLARAAFLAFALLLCRAGLSIPAMVLAALALVSEAALTHAVNGEGAIFAAEILHLLAVGAWLGSLPALLLLLRGPDATLAAQRFSGLGIAAVVAVAGSALALASAQLGGLGGLLGTAYGHVILLKLALFASLLTLAAINRLVLTPRLSASGLPGSGPGMLRVSVAVETGLGLCVLSAAAWLAALPPAAHEQPVWPFAWRPSLAILQAGAEAPGLVLEPVLAAIALVAAWALLAAALIRRRLRLMALPVVVLVTIAALPHLTVLLVPAYPTSYCRSPTDGAAASVIAGRALYATHCVACHGPGGRGDGPLARSLPVPPADLTAAHLLEHDDGELFWWISHGIDGEPGPDGAPRLVMPGFAATLDEQAIWELIDFIRANNPNFTADTSNRPSRGAPHVHTH